MVKGELYHNSGSRKSFQKPQFETRFLGPLFPTLCKAAAAFKYGRRRLAQKCQAACTWLCCHQRIYRDMLENYLEKACLPLQIEVISEKAR